MCSNVLFAVHVQPQVSACEALAVQLTMFIGAGACLTYLITALQATETSAGTHCSEQLLARRHLKQMQTLKHVTPLLCACIHCTTRRQQEIDRLLKQMPALCAALVTPPGRQGVARRAAQARGRAPLGPGERALWRRAPRPLHRKQNQLPDQGVARLARERRGRRDAVCNIGVHQCDAPRRRAHLPPRARPAARFADRQSGEHFRTQGAPFRPSWQRYAARHRGPALRDLQGSSNQRGAGRPQEARPHSTGPECASDLRAGQQQGPRAAAFASGTAYV